MNKIKKDLSNHLRNLDTTLTLFLNQINSCKDHRTIEMYLLIVPNNLLTNQFSKNHLLQIVRQIKSVQRLQNSFMLMKSQSKITKAQKRKTGFSTLTT